MNLLTRSEDIGKLLLRLSVGILMLFHGVSKLRNLETLGFIKNKLTMFSMPELLAYGVFLGEIVAPLLVIIGIYARFGGFIIFINMLFAIVLVHSNDLFALTDHGGWRLELQGLFLFGSLVIALIGSGRIAAKPD